MTAPATGTAAPDFSIRNLWKVFGHKADRIPADPEMAKLTGPEILEQTGCVAAVRDMSFDVGRGEVFVVMGLSGSGKSTLVRCLTRLIEPTAGQVLLEGNDIMKASPGDLRDITAQEDLHGVPAFRPAPAPERDRQRLLRPAGAWCRQVRALPEGPGRHRSRGLAGVRAALPRPAVRWHAATRRPGQGAGRRPRRLALRRTVLRPRSADPAGYAGRGDPAAPGHGQDDDLHYPRSCPKRSNSATES